MTNPGKLVATFLLSLFLIPGCTVQTADGDCSPATAVTSSCDGAVLVSTCGGERETRVTCDASACPGKRALGCRLDRDDRAYCECGCTPADEVCVAANTLRACFGGELVDLECSDEMCRQAGLGPVAGCGIAQDGRPNCLCESK